MITKAFLKAADPSFIVPALRHFEFLEKEFGFKFSGIAESYETILVAEKDDIILNVVFSLPEEPFLFIKIKHNNNKIFKHRYRPKNKDLLEYIKVFKSLRDSIQFEVWHKKLKNGEYNSLIENIICCLAEEVRIIQPWNRLPEAITVH